ncbi:hypothetical protein NQ314_014612 [Rhamnusium bicolor]|uniref:Uncharacterized protein n=1 Tax=Rhamnusium bicolor TaxID=1586634 RepID=A0AAV8X1W0_9CUCU|nr:hypothetical protein NQ314_014612 [Rhamnusium bicolor]
MLENYSQSLLNLVRKHANPLAQVIRRSKELNVNKINFISNASLEFQLDQQYSSGTLIAGCTAPEHKSAKFQNYKLSISRNDSCCILKDQSVIEMMNFALSSELNQYVVIGQRYQKKNDFFQSPCSSSLLNIYVVKNV